MPLPLSAAPSSEEFSSAVAERVLNTLRTAIIQEDPAAALALFDSQMPNRAALIDAVRSLFDRYTRFRVSYHIMQLGEAGQGTAVVEFTLEATPVNGVQPQVSRTEQLRFSFGQSNRTWKIADVQPRGFFSSFLDQP